MWNLPCNTSEGYLCEIHGGAAKYRCLHFNYSDSRKQYSSDVGVDCYSYKTLFADSREEKWE